MLPKTRAQEQQHRQRKRSREVSLIVDSISEVLSGERVNILEFGSGSGFQIPYLERLGTVTASDLQTSADVQNMPNANFVECSITDTPFDDEQFDLIFSNHVIEHIDDLPQAFAELRRIGKPSCLYAFSVPTNIWLLLSIPASYYEKVKKAVGVPSRYGVDGNWVDQPIKAAPRSATPQRRKLLHRLLPAGHGVTSDFGACYRQFQIKNWEQFFSSQGLSVFAIKPLLLYGPSQLPVIPTMNSVGRMCSSVLFLMRKGTPH